MLGIRSLCVFAVMAVIFTSLIDVSDSKFSINYTENTFYMDGKPFRYVAGSLHYFRIPKEYWRDRLRKIRAAGLNAISTYVEWSQHESKPGVFDFSDELDLQYFIQLAQEEKLYVILRPGPYICAERDMGGLPFWLLHKYPNIYLRTSDPNYEKYAGRWLNILMTQMTPLLYGNGGPIILVQVENEYGSYKACDRKHLIWLRDLFSRHVKDDAVLFTTDGAGENYLSCGKIPGVYATVDFGPLTDLKQAFGAQRKFEQQGPLVNSEYYPGWLTHWGEKMARTNTTHVTFTLKEMLDMGANINFYMFHGGTNFGFTAGANYNKKYLSDITSYDYDAPISEAGDLTEKYFAIKEVVKEYMTLDPNISVSDSKKGDYGEVELFAIANFLSPKVKEIIGVTRWGETPLSFESVNQNAGYLLYETTLTINATQKYLNIAFVRDIGNVYINGVYQGTLSREFNIDKVVLRSVKSGDRLSIVVENLGRVNYGMKINDTKGILSQVRVADKPLTSWNMTSFELKNVEMLEHCLFSNRFGSEDCLNGGGYTFYVGTFQVPDQAFDTFLDVSELTKGIVLVNNRNIGRYWSTRGPQFTLYVPGVYLKPSPAENVVIVMDEFISSPSIKVRFLKKPIFAY